MKLRKNNSKLLAFFLLGCCLLSFNLGETDRLGVPITKPSVFSFAEDILDVDLGNSDYHVKLRGKSLLIFAKKKDSQPTTLFVVYGKNKETYVAEIFPDDRAPLQRFIKSPTNPAPTTPAQPTDLKVQEVGKAIFSPNEKQAYYSYGMRKDGIQVILTNIVHQGDLTYLRLYIENNTTTHLKLAEFSFEYITYLRKFLLFKSTKTKLVEPIIPLSAMDVAPHGAHYFVVAIPTYTSNGGLEIFLGESGQGEREFKLVVPNKLLLKAQRK